MAEFFVSDTIPCLYTLAWLDCTRILRKQGCAIEEVYYSWPVNASYAPWIHFLGAKQRGNCVNDTVGARAVSLIVLC